MYRVKKFNESNIDNCTFEEFKDLLTDTLDPYDFLYDFKDYSSPNKGLSPSSTYLEYYACDIYLDFDEESIRLNLNFLEETDVLPYIDDYDTNVDLGNCLVEIDNNINRLEELKFNLVNIINRQIQFKKLIGDVDNELRNRFKIYPNFKSMTIGKDMNNVRITFDIIEDESKKNHHLFRKPSGEFN